MGVVESLWKGVSQVNLGKVGSCSRIKDENRRLTLGEDEVRRIWSDYFEDLYIDTQEEVAIYMCGFNGVQRGNYFGGGS